MVLQPFKLKMYKYFKWKVKNILNTCLILKNRLKEMFRKTILTELSECQIQIQKSYHLNQEQLNFSGGSQLISLNCEYFQYYFIEIVFKNQIEDIKIQARHI